MVKFESNEKAKMLQNKVKNYLENGMRFSKHQEGNFFEKVPSTSLN